MNKLFGRIMVLFCELAVSIFAISSIYVVAYNGIHGYVRISYVWGILCISGVMALGRIPFFICEKMSKVKMFISEVIYEVITIVLVFVLGYYLDWYCIEYKSTIASLCLVSIVCLTCGWVFTYIMSSRDASEILKKLQKRQKNISEDE